MNILKFIYKLETNLRDKIYACWVGENISGTMGKPYEGNIELYNIQGMSLSPEPISSWALVSFLSPE